MKAELNGDKISEKRNQPCEVKEELPAWLNLVRSHVASLKFGTVQVTVHDSRVIQIERLEKLRLDRP
jgi:hypothetical protein